MAAPLVNAAAMHGRWSMLPGHCDTLEIAPVLTQTVPKPVIVDIPFRASRHSSAICESCGGPRQC